MVSPCILLDCVRQSLKGMLIHHQGSPSFAPPGRYEAPLTNGWQDLHKRFWKKDTWVFVITRSMNSVLCSGPAHFRAEEIVAWMLKFPIRRDIKTKKARLSVQVHTSPISHGNSLQMTGSTICRGISPNFKKTVHRELSCDLTANELDLTTNLYHTNVNVFYQHLGGAKKFISHSACFCCSRELADHPLPCGHVICTPCIKGYGKAFDEVACLYSITMCPLRETDNIFQIP